MTVARIETFDPDRNEQAQTRRVPPLSLVPGNVPLSGIRGMRFERLAGPDGHNPNGLWILL